VLAARDDDPTALSALERLLAGERRFTELVEVLERQSDLCADASARKPLLARAAELEERELERRSRAIELWQRILGENEGDADALGALERLHEQAEDWRALADVIGRRIEVAAEGDARRALRLKLATLYEERIGDRFEAITCYQAMREADGDDLEALAALD